MNFFQYVTLPGKMIFRWPRREGPHILSKQVGALDGWDQIGWGKTEILLVLDSGLWELHVWQLNWLPIKL